MGIKDDPSTFIKAKDAKAFMGAKTPEEASLLIDRLVAHHAIRAVAAVVALHDKPLLMVAAPGDKAGARHLNEWLVKTVPALPPLDRSVVLVAIRKDGWVDTATWGKTRALCDAAAAWRDRLAEHFYHTPFTTWFGHGKDGVPTKLSAEQLATLTDASRAWVAERTHPDAKEP